MEYCDRIWRRELKTESFARRHRERVLEWFSDRLLEVNALRRTNPPDLGTLAALRDIRRGEHVARTTWSYEKWHQEVFIDSSGNSHHDIRAVLRNTSVETRPQIAVPVWSTFDQPPTGRVTIGRRSTTIDADPWDAKRHQGYLPVRFPKPLQPQESVAFKLEYLLVGPYRDADDAWFEWFFGAVHFEYRLHLTFEAPWKLGPVRAYVKELPAFPVPAPRVTATEIKWLVRFPVLASTYRLDFEFDQTPKDPRSR